MYSRHVSKETGVAPWLKTCELKYELTYTGIGKRGGC